MTWRLGWVVLVTPVLATACGIDCPDGTVVIDGRCVFELDAAVDADLPDAPVDVPVDSPMDAGPDTFDACTPVDEECNGADDDCDGNIDEEVMLTFFADEDGDRFGSEETCEACTVTECPADRAWVLEGGDCDDTMAEVGPGFDEVCDELDNDCDEITDEGVQTTYYADVDDDGFGDPDASMDACAVPTGFVDNNDDCDDADEDAFPGQTEFFGEPRVGGGFDYDCSGDLQRAARSMVDGDIPIDESAPVPSTRCDAACDLDSKWVGSLPPCGGTASYWTCALGASCLVGLFATVVNNQEVVCR